MIILPDKGCHLFIKLCLKLMAFKNPTVILESFAARWLFSVADKGHIADFEQERSGEERHIRREVKQRVDQHSLIDHQGIETCFACFNGTCHTDRSGANDDEIAHIGQNYGYS